MSSTTRYAIMKPMEINVLIEKQPGEGLDESWFLAVTEEALKTQGIHRGVELGLLLTGQEKIRELNKTYRDTDKATDVLAFPLAPVYIPGREPEEDFVSPPDGLKHLGEVVISYPQAQQQAAERGHSLKKELATLIIHGILHLLGYDHSEDKDEIEMKDRESLILKDLKGLME